MSTNASLRARSSEIGKPEDPSLITPLERVFDGHPNKESRSYILLGAHFDECLTFKTHIKMVSNKINQSIYRINRAKHFLTKKALESLYFALIHPHLLYCISIYSCTNTSNLKQLTILQKKAIRIINKSPPFAHTQPLFLESKILPFDLLVKQSKLLFMH